MRILITGDRFWACHALDARVLRRLVDRYGPDLVVVHGAAPGVDESFDSAARGLGIAVEPHPADWDRLGSRAGPARDQEMVDAGAALCVALHRFLTNGRGTKDCCRQAIQAGIPTYLIDLEAGIPRRLKADDPRLE
jgi:hypothetical protein